MRTTLRKENTGLRSFKKPFEFNTFSKIFYCGMTSLKNTRFFYTMSNTRTILTNKIMGQRQTLSHKIFKISNFR